MTLDAQSIGDAGMYKFGKTVVLKVTVFFLTSIQTFIQVMASFSLVALSTHDCCKLFFSHGGKNKDVSYWFCAHAGAGKDVD